MHLHSGNVLLHRPCGERIIKGPYLTITLPTEFRLALLDDMEQGSAGVLVYLFHRMYFL